MSISETCSKQARSLIVLRDLAMDIRDRLARLDLPGHYPAMFRVQLDHIRRSGYITGSEYDDLKNLVADVEGYLPAEPLPELEQPLLDVMGERMGKLQHSLLDAIKLKGKAEDIMFQKVVACECQMKELQELETK